jgi:hypothetical protein
MNVVSELVKTYVGYGTVLFTMVYFFYTAALYVPETESRVGLGFSLFDFMFFVYTFEETALPPLDVLPYFMIFDIGLKVNFLALLIDKVVGKGQYHKLFGVVCI